MSHLPPLARFVELARDVDFVPVYRELLSDALSPVQAFARLDRGSAAGLFESVIGGEKVGRYSFVASDPFLLVEAHGTNVIIRRCNGALGRGHSESETGSRVQGNRAVSPKGRATTLGRRTFDRRQPPRDAAARSASGSRRPPAGAAAIHRRRRRLRRLRHGSLCRAPAQRARRTIAVCPTLLRPVRPHGRLRQRAQDGARACARRRARRCRRSGADRALRCRGRARRRRG